MNATRPEAETEYSRGQQASGGRLGVPDRRRRSGPGGPPGAVRIGVLGAGLIGSALLLVAEFTPLLQVHSSASAVAIQTVQTGTHHSYALIPVGMLGLLLSYAVWRTRSRLALLAIGVLGLLALLVALLGDLPDAQASGLVGSSATHFATASSTPSVGLYLETLGAIVLLMTAGAGLLLLAPPEGARPGLSGS
ncbi:MAG: hypothetical protein ACR2MK_07260 [Solirubrobacteraceae bacterium]